jgi:hypothetical protein
VAVNNGAPLWIDHDRLDQPLDVTAPWRQVVEAAREGALLEASLVAPRSNLLATVEWIGPEDV